MFLNWQARDWDGLYADDIFFLNGNIIAFGDTDQDR